MLNVQSARWVDTTLTLKVGRRPAATLTCARLITIDCRGQIVGLATPDVLGDGDGEDAGVVILAVPLGDAPTGGGAPPCPAPP